MGGKKKKSAAAQAATPVAPSAATSRTGAAVAGNGVPEEAKKQQNSNKLTKETKSKGDFSLFGYCHRFRNTTVCIPRHRECTHVSVFWLKAQNPTFMRILVVSTSFLYHDALVSLIFSYTSK